ncbi:visual pigment-like receptor peropsin [Mercenaria mercenaria]|uniref:visual pigment-like receptor peropsin n=1 Tax=Mercenaria mercenaria TaxID=6596 RepID=UPI00234E5BB6|nr:visual pigment-like receptor peropsin [Mercenaria mercenaria]
MSSDIVIHSFYNRSDREVALLSENNGSTVNASHVVTDITLFQPISYYIIGSLMTIIMVIGFSTNLAILYTYATNRKIQTVDNTLIIGLALSDIGQAIFGIPFVVISSFSKHWIFGHTLCQYYAFITTSFGIAQIAMLTVIAMERYFVIVRHDKRLTNTPFRCMIAILGCFVYGSSWATGPLLGWSGYKEEEVGIACCVKWEVKDSSALSYTISLCTFGWFIPLFLIAFGYISIACSVSISTLLLHKSLYKSPVSSLCYCPV